MSMFPLVTAPLLTQLALLMTPCKKFTLVGSPVFGT